MFLALLLFSNVFAQVGINTNLPLKSLHIDGKKDNPNNALPTADQIKNDVVVDEEGRVGIGTVAPTAKLDVRGDSELQGNANITGALSLNKEVLLEKKSGEVGAYLVSQGVGKSPTWYVPKKSGQGDLTNIKEYSFLMLDGNGNSTVVNVDDLFQKYLKTLTIPSVELYASSSGTQLLKKEYNKITVFKSELPVSKFVQWNDVDKCIEIKEDGRYLLSMQIGVAIPKNFIDTNAKKEKVENTAGDYVNVVISSVLNEDIIIGFTSRDPNVGSDKTGLWVGRGVVRFYPAAGETRGFTSYSTLLTLKKGNKIYPIIFLNGGYGDNNVTLEGVQKGSAGDGVLTNLNVTKY